MNNNQFKTAVVFLIILILANLVLAIYATPVYDFGDGPCYLQMAESFFSHTDGMVFASRSPLYPVLLGILLKLFSEYTAIKLMVFLQYLMVAFTSWMIYKIFLPYFNKSRYVIIIAVIFNISLSTIYYSNMLITEILTVFLFVSAVFVLVRIYQCNKIGLYFMLGLILAFLILARYNTIPVIITFFSLLFINQFRAKFKIFVVVKSFLVLAIPMLVILNSWCFYNYHNYGFYNLFPQAGTSYQPRNVIVGSIHSGNTVSKENESVLQIFLNARRECNQMEKTNIKGGMSNLDKMNFLGSLYDGYQVYQIAKPALLKHFNLEVNNSELGLANKLRPFYNEIQKQNKEFIRKCRFYSLLSSFRASAGGGLPVKYGKINLNIFPGMIFVLYKVSIIGISILFWLGCIYYFFRVVIKKFRFDMTLFSLYGLVISFWLINFIFITVNDSNRFKFPSEPLIFGLVILSVSKGIKSLRERCNFSQNKTLR